MIEDLEIEKIDNDEASDEDFQQLLDDFIASELKDVDTGVKEKPQTEAVPSAPKGNNQPQPKPLSKNDEALKYLKKNEKNLFIAYNGFIDSVNYIASKNNIPLINVSITAEMLMPNYKPSIGKIIQKDTLSSWDIIIKVYSDKIKDLNPSSTDDELLDFAESCTENQLTLAIISYVETVIEFDGCELYYEGNLLKAQKRRIERQIYEAHLDRIDRCKRYVEAIEEKNFPINAEKLINNYFKTAQKDPEGAYQVLIQTPATYAPIDFSKVKSKFFGLIKVKPTDGYKINKMIGNFLKKLKA